MKLIILTKSTMAAINAVRKALEAHHGGKHVEFVDNSMTIKSSAIPKKGRMALDITLSGSFSFVGSKCRIRAIRAKVEVTKHRTDSNMHSKWTLHGIVYGMWIDGSMIAVPRHEQPPKVKPSSKHRVPVMSPPKPDILIDWVANSGFFAPRNGVVRNVVIRNGN